MTTEELQAHEKEMAAQRERFQRFWEQIIEPLLWSTMYTHEKMALQHKAWQLWRELKEGE